MRENKRVFPGDASKGEIEILREDVVWENEVARLFNDHVRFPATEEGKHVEAQQFRLAPAESKDDGVVVVPITGDGHILLVRQFRHPVRMWMRELPRGARERGESPAEAAARELREELGCEAVETYRLGRVATDSGQTTGVPFVYAARVVERGEREPEQTEAIDGVCSYSYTEMKRACQTGAVIDAFTLAAVTRLEPHFAGGRFEYRPEAAPPEDADEV